MKQFLVFICILIFNSGFAQKLNWHQEEFVRKVNPDSLMKFIITHESFGLKNDTSQAVANAGMEIESFLKRYGYTVSRDSFKLQGNDLFNVIGEKEGTSNPDKIMLLLAHYDSYRGPGANDNGSGVSILKEMARVLASYSPAYTLRFCFFSAEESGFHGSIQYSNNVVHKKNENVFLVFNIDQVGGNSNQNSNRIYCERDESEPLGANSKSFDYTDTLAHFIDNYTSLEPILARAWGSDYMPFQDLDYVITGLYESPKSPFTHSLNDSASKINLGYLSEVTKGSMAATVYFAAYQKDLASKPELPRDIELKVYQNQNGLNFKISGQDEWYVQITDLNGRILKTFDFREQYDLSVDNLGITSNSILIAHFRNKNRPIQFSRKVLVNRTY